MRTYKVPATTKQVMEAPDKMKWLDADWSALASKQQAASLYMEMSLYAL